MNKKLTITLIIIVAILAVAVTSTLSCTSTSEDYRQRTITINVQPAQPILIQRYQAPQLRLFCFSTQQISGTTTTACPSSSAASSALVLCSRVSNNPSAPATCEKIPSVTEETVRGSINGPEYVWDLLWDGSTLSPQCFPRGVTFSYLALVRGKDVSSVGLFVVLLIIAILAFLLAVMSLGVFVRSRIQVFDSAGATTIAGPKGDFGGHQMQVRSGAAADAQTTYEGQVPTVYLPVRESGATGSLYGAEGDEQDALGASAGPASASAASRAPRAIAMKGASPPRPGDGIEGFEGATRDMDMDGMSRGGPGAFDGIGGKYASGGPMSSIRRRRGYKPHRGAGRGDDDDDRAFGPGGRRTKALFPTHYDWEAHDGLGDGGPDGRPRGDKFDRLSSGHYVDEDGNAFTRDGQPLAGAGGVRYVPQWMHSFHGRDEDGSGDAYDPNDGFASRPGTDGLNNSALGDGSRDPRSGKGLQVSELGVYNRPKPKKSRDGEDDAGYESESGRHVHFAGEGKKRKKTPTSGKNTPRGGRAGRTGSRMDDDENSGFGGPSGARRSQQDAFKRDRAHVFNDKLQLDKDGKRLGNMDPNGTGPDRIEVHRKFGGGDPNTVTIGERQQFTRLQCAHCKALLDGTAPRACPVTGEYHQQ